MPSTDFEIDADELLELARDLIRIPSIYTHEAEISNFIFNRLEGWGLSPRRVPVEGHGPCVVAEVGDKESPSIVFNGHMDTVEVMAGWEHDPFGAELENGRLFGLGSLDMKCGLAAMMVAFKAMAESGTFDGHRIIMQAVTGEEDNGAGTRALIQNGEFDGADAVIVGEGFGGLKAVTNGRRGGAYYNFNVRGQAAHGAMPHLGKNAILDAAKIVCALEKVELAEADGLKSDAFEPLRETQTVLRISGGDVSLSVPEKCTVELVRCTIPGGRTDLMAELESLVRGLSLECQVDIIFKGGPGDLYLPYLTSPESALVSAARESIVEHTGDEPQLVCGVSEADDNLISQELGVPVICVGPGEVGEMARYHRPEESISISQIATAAKVYCSTAHRLVRV